jgi:hypothetical protein
MKRTRGDNDEEVSKIEEGGPNSGRLFYEKKLAELEAERTAIKDGKFGCFGYFL